MSRPSKKHHFVPQAQLRNFAADTERRFLFVLDKQTDRSFRTSILNAGSENDFNTVSLGASKWNFEDLFREVDARSARLIEEILSRRSVVWLSEDDRLALADLFATQLLRTHFGRTTPGHLAERLREIIRQFGYDPDQDPTMAKPSDAALRLGSVKTFLDRSEQVVALLRLYPALYSAEGIHHFAISDNPVTVTNAFPYGDLGLGSHGILVFLPISPKIMIALHCPTIVKRYELAGRADLPVDRKERLLRYRDGMRYGNPIDIDEDMVLFLNHQQVVHSTRYLYAATDTFDLAREALKQHPHLRSVTTHLTMGEMGRAPEGRVRMPAGTRLVVHGPADHGMLKIEEIDEAGEGITARTDQIALLAQMAADPGMLRVELYIDGHCKRMLGDAMIEPCGNSADGWFRVVHRDPGLRELDKRLDRDRR
ncbi:DUF4238 domain-containing protein [Bradyrhizobium sp. 183]|uniref:DUF4238 domain-containing protein n=1 Tax=unclassified Bradyrhizobium TaxID=2631580 RepID=UPI001FFEBCCE|nr:MULTISPECIES: DUF4238 domain-containing protein [unclassified Bradyrhizobium]UPJ79482.1 DUF4238 domain-containing protein [Bradyrhizobium sp. 184]UPJ87278.1 DUF4238 domain-containing protein [Bradyrhizobium sp. 183]